MPYREKVKRSTMPSVLRLIRRNLSIIQIISVIFVMLTLFLALMPSAFLEPVSPPRRYPIETPTDSVQNYVPRDVLYSMPHQSNFRPFIMWTEYKGSQAYIEFDSDYSKPPQLRLHAEHGSTKLFPLPNLDNFYHWPQFVWAPDGSNNVAPQQRLIWSPDGQFILFEYYSGNIDHTTDSNHGLKLNTWY